MATAFPNLSLFLLLLLAFQEMMPSEAAMCQTPSKTFTGLCFSRKNCTTICEKEGFVFGVCKKFKCVCAKDCNAGGGGGGSGGGGENPGDGGGGGETPGEGPPDEGPPDQGGPGSGDEPLVLNRKSLVKP